MQQPLITIIGVKEYEKVKTFLNDTWLEFVFQDVIFKFEKALKDEKINLLHKAISNLDALAIKNNEFDIKNIDSNNYQPNELVVNMCNGVYAQCRTKELPLIRAIYLDIKFLEILLQNKADPNKLSMFSGTYPLACAAQNGLVQHVTMLLQYNADIKILDICKKSAVWYAHRYKREKCLQLLLDHEQALDDKESDNNNSQELLKSKKRNILEEDNHNNKALKKE